MNAECSCTGWASSLLLPPESSMATYGPYSPWQILYVKYARSPNVVFTRSEKKYKGSHYFTLKRIYYKEACLWPRVCCRLHCRGNIPPLCSRKYLWWQSLSCSPDSVLDKSLFVRLTKCNTPAQLHIVDDWNSVDCWYLFTYFTLTPSLYVTTCWHV